MLNIKSATPIGFSIKEKDTIYFKGNPILPPLPKNILADIKMNPHRWKIEEGLNLREVSNVDVKTMDIDILDELKLTEDTEKIETVVSSKRNKPGRPKNR